MNKPSLKGKRYVNLLRCSTHDQDTSIADQKLTNDAFGREHGLTHFADVIAEGVSGSMTFNRVDIDGLIDRKLAGESFEVVLVHDLSRLTRGGIAHGHSLKKRFARAGLSIVSVGDNLPAGDESDLIESVIHYKNQLYSKNLSLVTTRGQYSSIANGWAAHSTTTPYGYDRLYISSSGTPTLLVRPVEDRVRLKLDPETKKVLGQIPSGVKFIKQRDEISRLVPGDPSKVETVQWMFREHYVNNVGIAAIANTLNLVKRIRSPQGKMWSARTVHQMLRNKTYLGEPVAFRVSKGKYHKGSVNAPTPVVVDQDVLEAEGKKSIPVTRRPVEEWLSVPAPDSYEHIAIITDPDVVRTASKEIEEYWMRWVDGRNQEVSRDKHKSSRYFLKNLLHSKQQNLPMHGRTTIKDERYYRIRNAEITNAKYSVLRKQIPAAPIEKAVLTILDGVFGDQDDVGASIEKHIVAYIESATDTTDRKHQLDAEAKKLARRLKLIYETSDEGDTNDADLRQTIAALKGQQRQIKDELLAIATSPSADTLNVADIKESVLSQFTNLAEHVRSGVLAPMQLRKLVEALCSTLTVDLVTRELEIDLRLPSWAMSRGPAIEEVMGLVLQQARSTPHETHAIPPLELGFFKCEHHRDSIKKPICYRCRRISVSDERPILKAA